MKLLTGEIKIKKNMTTDARISKKEVAAIAGIAPRTLRHRKNDFGFLENCRLRGTGRPTYSRQRVTEEMRRRRII